MDNNGQKQFLIGALIGSAVGAITALLFAPKSGKELRRDIADKSSEVYGKAADYYNTTSEKVSEAVKNTYNTGLEKANQFFNSAKEQANNMKNKASDVMDTVKKEADNVKNAAKESIYTFKNEVRNNQQPQ